MIQILKLESRESRTRSKNENVLISGIGTDKLCYVREHVNTPISILSNENAHVIQIIRMCCSSWLSHGTRDDIHMFFRQITNFNTKLWDKKFVPVCLYYHMIIDRQNLGPDR